ncbi:MAG: outer membrane protein transport protein [Gammaproteobacteria bacterium]|nr:outer membrane protein transport protein [Gammaproteobacteria bacterium]
MTRKVLRPAAMVTAISAISSGALAAGFQLQENSISGLGRAYAAQNTVGDDASILARNPAGSSLFKKMTITGGIMYVNPEVDAEGDVTTTLSISGFDAPSESPDQKANDFASTAWVPNAFIAIPINDSWSAGLGLYTDYGLETDFSSSALTTPLAKKTSLKTYNIAPSIAYDFNDTFSIGIAANILYADATLETQYPTDLQLGSLGPQGAQINSLLADKSILDVEGDAWEVSWSIGALWNITDQTRAGISYHSESRPKLKGRIKSDLQRVADGSLLNASGNLTLDLPDIMELGLYHNFNEHWSLAVGALWTDWDDFEKLEARIPSEPDLDPLELREENFESGWRYSVGVEYQPCEELTWRIGYAYDEGAARDGFNEGKSEPGLPVTWRNLSIPDSDRQWVTFGGTYAFNQKLSIDGGLAFLWGKDEPVDDFFRAELPDPATGRPIGNITTAYDGKTSKVEAWLFGVGLNYQF